MSKFGGAHLSIHVPDELVDLALEGHRESARKITEAFEEAQAHGRSEEIKTKCLAMGHKSAAAVEYAIRVALAAAAARPRDATGRVITMEQPLYLKYRKHNAVFWRCKVFHTQQFAAFAEAVKDLELAEAMQSSELLLRDMTAGELTGVVRACIRAEFARMPQPTSEREDAESQDEPSSEGVSTSERESEQEPKRVRKASGRGLACGQEDVSLSLVQDVQELMNAWKRQQPKEEQGHVRSWRIRTQDSVWCKRKFIIKQVESDAAELDDEEKAITDMEALLIKLEDARTRKAIEDGKQQRKRGRAWTTLYQHLKKNKK